MRVKDGIVWTAAFQNNAVELNASFRMANDGLDQPWATRLSIQSNSSFRS